jgi:hypothetical protein
MLTLMWFSFIVAGILRSGYSLIWILPVFIAGWCSLNFEIFALFDGGIKNYIKRWNRWRKFNANSKWHKLLVLMDFRYSPTFEFADVIGDEIDNIEGRLDKKISLTVRDENPKEAKEWQQ